MEDTGTIKSFRSLGNAGLVLGLLGVGACLGGIFGGAELRKEILHGYLYGWVFWVMVAFGCLGLTTLTHAVKASWGNGILRLLEAGGSAATFVWLLVLSAPIFLYAGEIYPWADQGMVAKMEVLKFRAVFMNTPAVAIRTAFFLLLWAAFSHGLRQSTLRDEQGHGPSEIGSRATWGAVGLVMVILTGTFAFLDWTMSLDAHFYSTIWGGLYAVGGGLAALSFCTFLLCWNADKAPFNEVANHRLLKDLGNLMFVFTMLWGYFNFSQYLIIWSGNLPATASYYKARSDGGFYMLGGLLLLGQFVVPFFTLLIPRVKKLPSLLKWIALWIFVFRMIDSYNTMIPFFKGHGLAPHWGELAALVGIGGFWLFTFGKASEASSVVQNFDNRLREVAHHA